MPSLQATLKIETRAARFAAFKQELNLMLDEAEKVLVADFISENWQLFVDRAAESGYSEAEAEYIYAKLERGV